MKGNSKDVLTSTLYVAIVVVSLSISVGLVNQVLAANSNTVSTPQVGISVDNSCDITSII